MWMPLKNQMRLERENFWRPRFRATMCVHMYVYITRWWDLPTYVVAFEQVCTHMRTLLGCDTRLEELPWRPAAWSPTPSSICWRFRANGPILKSIFGICTGLAAMEFMVWTKSQTWKCVRVVSTTDIEFTYGVNQNRLNSKCIAVKGSLVLHFCKCCGSG